MSYPYFAVVKDDDSDEIGFYPEPYYCDNDGRIIGELPDLAEVNASLLGWAIDLQDVAVIALRALGSYPGLGGRVKKTGVILCTWSGQPVGSDYLRISLNGVVCNPDDYPVEADLLHNLINDLASKYPSVVKTLEMA